MRWTTSAIICVAAFSSFADAQVVTNSNSYFSIESVKSCGKWVAVRKESGLRAAQSDAWIVGFVSGLALTSKRDFLHGLDAESVLLHVDKHCRDNPLSTPIHAVTALSSR